MKDGESSRNFTPLDPEETKQKLEEASLYLSHGLFDEAREIYQSLLSHFQARAQKVGASAPEARRLAQKRVQVLKKRLVEIDRQATEFHGRPKPAEPLPRTKSATDAESIFNSGLALKEIGLYEEAIDEFKHAAELGHRVVESYEEIGSSLISRGAYQEGIGTLRQTLRLEGTSSSHSLSILEKIGSAYEAADDKKRALQAYQELRAIDEGHEKAFQKIKELTRELKRFRFSLATICEHPRISLIVSLLFAAVFIAFIPFVKTVDNVDYFALQDHPDTKFYDRFKEVFGNDEFFVIAFARDNIFTKEKLSLIKEITEELEDIEDIRDLRSLANVDDTVGEQDYFEVRKFLEEIPEDKSELERLRKQAINNPLYAKNLLSPDARTAAIAVLTYSKQDDESYRKRLVNQTNKVLDSHRDKADRFHLAGWTIINLNLSQYMQRDIVTFIPVTYLLIGLTTLLFFRNVRLTLLAVANISICVGSTMGLFGLSGITLNNVTTIVPPLVMALALCDTVHIFSYMDRGVLAELPDKRKALASVLKKVVMPCFLTTLTTGIGFLALAVSEVSPVREFAWLASAGMGFEFIYSFLFLPPLILFFEPEKVYRDYETQKGMATFLTKINDLVQRRYKLIVALSCILVLAACWFTSKIRVETNLLEYFKKSSPVRTSLTFVEERLSGVGTLDISFQAKEEDAFKQPTNLQVIERMQRYLKSLRGVDVTISFVDFIKDMNQSFHDENPSFYRIPETMEMVSQYLLLYDSDEIEDFINASYDHARISVRISEHSSAEQARLIREIKNFAEKIDKHGLDIRVTGRAVQDVNTIDALVNGQVYSLGIAIFVISIIMVLVLKSVRIGLLSLVPNLFPIILNFGIMGVAGITLNMATALIAAVAIGIAVDDTIHFLSEYKIRRAQGLSIPNSLRIVTLVKGRAILSSSLILCIGFGVLVSSNFGPTMNFGILSAIIMITAVIGDLIVLPSIILLKRSR